MQTRHLLSFAAVTSLVLVACSLAVQSELDGKPAGVGGASADAGGDALGGTGGTAEDAPVDQVSDPAADPGSEPTLDAPDDSADQEVPDGPQDAPLDTADAESGACTSCWSPIAEPSPDNERARACAVWAGDRVFIWGGMRLPGNELRDDGLTYDPSHDQWAAVGTDANSPSARAEPVCLWTGSKVFVWGGTDPATQAVFADGALWNPATDSWEKLASGAPVGRTRPVALWAGSMALIWGGTDPTSNHGVKTGAIWSESTSEWTPISVTNAPAKNKELAGVWTGSDALIFGGRDDGGGNVYNTLYAYTPPASDLWTLVAPAGTAPSIRSSAFVGYVNSRMLVWGGLDKTFVALGDGGQVKLAAPTAWATLSSNGAPSARSAAPFESGWAAIQGTKMHVLGGLVSAATPATDGGTYDQAADSWSPIPSWGIAPHLYGIGVWTGSEFIIWGGYDGSTPLLDGTRWMP